MVNIAIVSLLAMSTVYFMYLIGGIHLIYEGHIGIYSRGGALLNTIGKPGFSYMIPIITQFNHIQVTIQTDKVTDIPCGTSGGVMIYFDNVEVVNRLKENLAFQTIKNYTINYDSTWIFDKIHHEINQFCSKHSLQEVYITQFNILDDYLKNALQDGCDKYAPGIEIISVRVTKPRIPQDIANNYEKMELSKIELLIAKEKQKVLEKESETLKMLNKIEAETYAEVSKIQMELDLLEKEGNKKIQEIQSQMNLEKENTKTDAANYKNLQEIEIYKNQLSDQFLQEFTIQRVQNISKTYYGDSIQEYFKKNINYLEAVEVQYKKLNPNP